MKYDTQSRSLEQSMTVAKKSLYCILKNNKIQKVMLTFDFEDANQRWDWPTKEAYLHKMGTSWGIQQNQVWTGRGEIIVQCNYSESYKNIE